MADFTWEDLCDLAAKHPHNAPGKMKAVALAEAEAAIAALTGAEAAPPSRADVIEECARVAEDDDGVLTQWGEDRNTAVAQRTAKSIATAIRKLKDTP
jgi:hypothetical protein